MQFRLASATRKTKSSTKTNGKKKNRHGVTNQMKGHFEKAGVSGKRYVREFKFENAADTIRQRKSRLISLQQATRLTQLQFQKVKVSRVLSRDMVSTEDLWLMVLNIHRHAGSNGACSDPSKVFKGKGMPGHMGK